MRCAKRCVGCLILVVAAFVPVSPTWAAPLYSVTRYDWREREDTTGELKNETSFSRPNKWVYQYVDNEVQLGSYKFIVPAGYDGGEAILPYYTQPVRLSDWTPGSRTALAKPFFDTLLRCDFNSIETGFATNDFESLSYTEHIKYALPAAPLQSESYAFDCNYWEPISLLDSPWIWMDVAGGGAISYRAEDDYRHPVFANFLYPFIKYIGSHCFASNPVLTNVVIPEGVTDIEEGAFMDCKNLASVTMPSTLEFIGADAFAGCDALEAFCVESDNPAFKSVDGVLFTKDGKKLVAFPPGKAGTYFLPADVETIAEHAFDGCTKTVVEIPWDNSLEFVWRYHSPDTPVVQGENPFGDCSQVHMDVPEGIETVGSWDNPALGYCTHVSLPATWKAFSGAAQFHNCYDLVFFEVAEDNPDYRSENGVIYSSDGKTLAAFPLGIRGIFSVPEGIETIGEDAFAECFLDGVIFPETLREIEYYAFAKCWHLAEVRFPASLETIRAFAFYDTGLESLCIPASVKSIGTAAFCDCIHLQEIEVEEENESYGASNGILSSKDGTELICYPGGRQGACTIPEHFRIICSYAFSGVGLTSVVIPRTIEDIWESAFYMCENLVSADLPDNLTQIPDEMFVYCFSLESIQVPEGVARIGEGAFFCCSGLSCVTIPDSVTCIGADAFDGCASMLYDTNSIPGVVLVDGWAVGATDTLCPYLDLTGCRGIADSAFLDCTALADVTIGNGTGSIGNGAFENCTALTSVDIPDSVTIIGERAFSGCNGLESVRIGAGVEDEASIGRAFADCSALTQLLVDEEHPVWRSVEGVLFSKDMTRIVRVPCGKSGVYAVPAEVTSVAEACFEGCAQLTEVTLPNGSADIGSEAFSGSSGLATLHVPLAWKEKYVDGMFWSDYAAVPEDCKILYEADWALPAVAEAAEVAEVLAGAADGRLKTEIGTVEEYNEFRTWFAEKGLDPQTVKDSAHAWVSWVLGAETLFENEPEVRIEDVEFGGGGTGGGVAAEVRVTVKDGETAAAVDAGKVALLFEATGGVGEWVAGALPVEAVAKGREGDAMVFEVVPGTGSAGAVFLRLAK